ncbi:hypothetical protein [Reinekea marinisedimentorum]|uniref:Glycosyl transferase family 8 n=1 Tax=Reinekea marinisedimentorum TaxID=230495 RepID=A0A4R3I750_9GAMM|nr:hypothetical protein [Reinekea marinisedimentorum]TCS41966.1 hypothetical protein BCF53_10470 [Reinekea marinisedimentorum]
MNHFVCYHWGELYSPENVERLYRSVKAQFSYPFEFHCVTAEDIELRPEITVHELPYGKPFKGNWNKLRTFSEGFLGLPNGDTAIVLDLDILITGSLDFLIEDLPEEPLVFARDKHKSRLGLVQTSVYRVKINHRPEIWNSIVAGDHDQIRKEIGKESDQCWIDRYYPKGQPKFFDGDKIVSYKYDCYSKGIAPFGDGLAKKGITTARWGQAKLPENARVVMFHGRPDMHEIEGAHWGKWKRASFIKDFQY